MIVDPATPPHPKYWESTPSIKTELIDRGFLKLVKATVIVGQMTITAFSDAVEESPNHTLPDCTRQATQRAMQLIPRH